jgi:Fe-S cluster assembly protein SufD
LNLSSADTLASEKALQHSGVGMSSVVEIPHSGKAESSSSWVEQALESAKSRQQELSLPKALAAIIEEARAAWSKVRFPTPKLEAWKYTNPAVIAEGPFRVSAQEADISEVKALLDQATIAGLDESSRLVFVDGVFSAELSRVEAAQGLKVERVAEGNGSSGAAEVGSLELHKDEPFAALATALISDAVCLTVARGAVVERPVQVVHLVSARADSAVLTPRIHIKALEGSQVTVVESFVGASGIRYLSLPMSEIRAEGNARVDYYNVQCQSEAAYHVSGAVVEQHRDSEVRTHIFSFGGALVRNNAQVRLKGSNSNAVLNGLSLLSASQHVDNATLIHHIEPSAESREHFKGIYAGESRGVFSGTITVEKEAQKTNAFQSNQALLLSGEASIETRPQLKIWADDVKCTHGATVGQLDKNALFYLQSRGISREEAKAFLVHAFASEVLTSVRNDAVKQYVEGIISQRLAALAR